MRGITKVFGLLLVFAFLFSFSSCYLKDNTPSGEPRLPQNQERDIEVVHVPDSDDNESVVDYFKKDGDGNYVYFKDYADEFKGIELLSTPKKGKESGNADTDFERERFWNDLDFQFEVLSYYITNYIVGNFGGGIDGGEVRSDLDELGDYVLEIEEILPTIRDAALFDTNEFSIERTVLGWHEEEIDDGEGVTTVLTPVYGTDQNAYVWNLRLGVSCIGNYYLQTFVDNFLPFFKLKLLELASNSLYKTEITIPIEMAYDVLNCENEYNKRLKSFKELGFEFGDFNVFGTFGHNLWEFLIYDVVGEDSLNYQSSTKTLFLYDEEGQKIPGTGVEKTIDDGFFVDYETIFNGLLTRLKVFVDGDEDLDVESKFPKVLGLEVEDIDSKDFFTPGMKKSESPYGKKSLTNMDYSEYKSVVFFPGEIVKFDYLTFVVDSETNFALKIWMRYVCERGSFLVPVCIMNLDSEKDYDYETHFEYHQGGAETEVTREEIQTYLFDNPETRNTVDITIDYLLNEEQLALITNSGLSPYEEDLNYTGRGYHTNAYDNLSVLDDYALTEVDEKEIILYEGDGNYLEFLFEIVDRDPTLDYNFKFLIVLDSFEDYDDEQA